MKIESRKIEILYTYTIISTYPTQLNIMQTIDRIQRLPDDMIREIYSFAYPNIKLQLWNETNIRDKMIYLLYSGYKKYILKIFKRYFPYDPTQFRYYPSKRIHSYNVGYYYIEDSTNYYFLISQIINRLNVLSYQYSNTEKIYKCYASYIYCYDKLKKREDYEDDLSLESSDDEEEES